MPGSHASRLLPLPVRPRPKAGETASSYVRRLAAANHLRPSYLHSLLRNPFPIGGISPEGLAALSGRSAQALKRTLDGLGNRAPGTRSWPAGSGIVFLASLIDAMIAADPATSAMQIWRQLIDEHQAEIGYPAVLRYCQRHFPRPAGEDQLRQSRSTRPLALPPDPAPAEEPSQRRLTAPGQSVAPGKDF